jgi:hypothetical protein
MLICSCNYLDVEDIIVVGRFLGEDWVVLPLPFRFDGDNVVYKEDSIFVNILKINDWMYIWLFQVAA